MDETDSRRFTHGVFPTARRDTANADRSKERRSDLVVSMRGF
jgi:hypothetical protein